MADVEPASPPNVPQVGKKPLRVSTWLVGITAILVVAYVAISLIHLPGSSGTASRQNPPRTAPASQSDLDNYNQARKANLAEIQKRRDLLAKEIREAGFENEAALVELVNTLPPCDSAQRAKMNGQGYVVVNQQTRQIAQFVCEADNSWHPLPAAATGIQPPTEEQQIAMKNKGATNPHTGGEPAMSPKERAAKALEAALNSPSVSDYTAAESAKPPAASPAVPMLVPVAERTEAAAASPAPDLKRYDWDTYTGQLYWVFDGTPIDCILVNRLAGEYTGPISVMVRTPVYSHDHLHIVIPKGTRILGEASKVSVIGQQRLAITFQNGYMPDGFAVDFPRLAGLDQQGATGLTGRVNTHWPQLIATAALVGAIGGLSEASVSGSYSLSGVDAIRLGVGQQSGQEVMQILDRLLNRLPTVTVYEGSLVTVMVMKSFQLPALENHTVRPNL